MKPEPRKSHKLRLDLFMHQTGLAQSREMAQRLIMAGDVLVNELVTTKPGTLIDPSSVLRIKVRPRFVSRGGDKLQAAVNSFGAAVQDRICADVGASTGGFTDCLLQNGARRIYAIDVGYGQLDWRIRNDSRVVVIERTNARYLSTLPEQVEFIVIDVSFISLNLILPVVRNWLTPHNQLIVLIKPQFEAGKSLVGKGGVVRDPEVHQHVLLRVLEFASAEGFSIRGLVPSPLRGPSGNIEFLAYMSWRTESPTHDISALTLSAIELSKTMP